MRVAVVDYGSGNLRSAAKALERAAREADLAAEVVVTGEAAAVRGADRIVLPGVGAFGDCRRGLDALSGMAAALEAAAIAAARPFLGICVGMQLMASVGREHGDHPGLGWIPGEVVALEPAGPGPAANSGTHCLDGDHPLLAKAVPHMGWNALSIEAGGHPVLADLGDDPHVYFVHGYHMRARDPGHVLATADYGGRVAAAVGRDNLIGTQFHPEKSQAVGLRLLGNFLRWSP